MGWRLRSLSVDEIAQGELVEREGNRGGLPGQHLLEFTQEREKKV